MQGKDYGIITIKNFLFLNFSGLNPDSTQGFTKNADR